MKSYYILNTKTDQNFDPIENKFFSNSLSETKLGYEKLLFNE